MAFNFKGMTKILLGNDVFLSINSVNGDGVITLCKGRKIPSAIYPHRTITIPSPNFVSMTYSQFIELVDKAPLLFSVFKSIKEKDFTQASDDSLETPKKKVNYVTQKKSNRSQFENKRQISYSRKRCSLAKQKNLEKQKNQPTTEIKADCKETSLNNHQIQ